MKKKIIGILVIALIVAGFVVNHLISYANVAKPAIYIGLSKKYGNGNPSNGGEHIWNITTYNSTAKDDVATQQRNLYCVNADYGQTWFYDKEDDAILDYKLYYNVQSQNDIKTLKTVLEDNNDDGIEKLFNEITIENGKTYEFSKELLWLLDNLYIPAKTLDVATDVEIATDVNNFLAKVGILKDEDENKYYYQANNNWVCDGEDPKERDIANDIIAVQRMAIWYFTDGINRTGVNQNAWLFVDEGTGYTNLSESRNDIAMYLYNYLIDAAEEHADEYISENIITVNTDNLEKEDKNFILQTKIINGKYVTGPIIIEKENENPFNINLAVTNGTDNVNYTITEADGTAITNATIESVVGKAEGFYISTDIIDGLNIAVTVTPTTTTKTLWLAGEESNGVITSLEGEQPVIEISKETTTTNFIVKPFDLALRKYITSVKSGETVTAIDTRIPNYKDNIVTKLQNGTTAEYKHRKDPVSVQEYDEVTYNITIYNEGSKAGYAKTIIDQLPDGLVWSTKDSKIVYSKGPDGKDRNQYKLDYQASNNQIKLTIIQWPEELEQEETDATEYVNSLKPYSEGTLDYETIQIKCIVTQKPHSTDDKILTNVAWISEAYDSESQKEISSTGILDRDSEPQTSPNVNKDMDKTMSYIGNTSNKTDLTDDLYHYAGEQDDDDFEKVVVKAVPKKFDLALVKFIAAISDDEKIEESEYLKEADGTYSREPEVKYNTETGKIEYDFTNKGAKNPLIVEPGDYVLYTIRVYNEGEVNGYASKIRDELPAGLEFVEANEEYNGIWEIEKETLNKEDRVEITTNWYAKGNSYEKLLTAFDKDKGISKQNPDHLDAQVLCKVVEQATSDRILVNYAQIAEHTDETGDDKIVDIDSTPDKWDDKDDDQDIERIQLQYFDLSLRKFITAVNKTELKDANGKYTREPVVDVTTLETTTTAKYTHSKQPIVVRVGDKVVYTIRVYNEGSINGFASKVTDYLPPYLTFIKDSQINKEYGWQISDDGRIATSTYLANTELDKFNGTELDYADLKIECIVSEKAPLKQNQTNIAEISEYKYNGNTVKKDIDSTADNMVSAKYLPSDEQLPSYKNDKLSEAYVPGNEDDDDFEKVYVQEFDLALRKFITKVQNTEVTTREPQVKIENGTISYEHLKDALTVHVGDVVTYTLRIYNEGEISGYASEITDDIPEYLEYLPEDSTNVEYMWKMYDENGNETEKVEEAVKVKTTYLSKEDKLIKAFDGTTLDYKDIKISFKVKDPNSNTYIITNHAQISDDADENGNEVQDKDSTPDEWIDNEQHKDDDQDIENVKVQYFDLSLLKFVSKVIVTENGKQTITETGYNGHEDPEPVVKVELHKKKLNKVVVKFGYGITITNEGDIAGYATEITDYIPQGLKFDPADNPEWMDEGNNVISTRQLEGTLLQPGESKTVEVILTWINGADNLALKTNTAEISEDKNEYDVPDKDSTPDNKVDGEDDIDIAKVILNISTGAAKTYFMLTLGLLAVVLVGVALIKKFVI